MESKRRSLAIKDTDLLEKMLRGDLDLENRNDIIPPSPTASSASSFDQQQHYDNEDDDDVDDNNKMDHGYEKDREGEHHESSPTEEKTASPPLRQATSFLSGTFIPCGYPSHHHPSPPDTPLASPITPAVFTLMAFFLGCAAQLGITDDWTLPLTLTVLISGFLWSGGAKGMQLKVRLQ